MVSMYKSKPIRLNDDLITVELFDRFSTGKAYSLSLGKYITYFSILLIVLFITKKNKYDFFIFFFLFLLSQKGSFVMVKNLFNEQMVKNTF